MNAASDEKQKYQKASYEVLEARTRDICPPVWTFA
jgi:hypothetical protein